MPRLLWWSYGGRRVLTSEVPLHAKYLELGSALDAHVVRDRHALRAQRHTGETRPYETVPPVRTA